MKEREARVCVCVFEQDVELKLSEVAALETNCLSSQHHGKLLDDMMKVKCFRNMLIQMSIYIFSDPEYLGLVGPNVFLLMR